MRNSIVQFLIRQKNAVWVQGPNQEPRLVKNESAQKYHNLIEFQKIGLLNLEGFQNDHLGKGTP